MALYNAIQKHSQLLAIEIFAQVSKLEPSQKERVFRETFTELINNQHLSVARELTIFTKNVPIASLIFTIQNDDYDTLHDVYEFFPDLNLNAIVKLAKDYDAHCVANWAEDTILEKKKESVNQQISENALAENARAENALAENAWAEEA